MADRRGLGMIGWIMGAVTATVIAISGIVVTSSVPEAAPASQTLAVSAR